MIRTRKYVVAAMMFFGLLIASCSSSSSPNVEIAVDPKDMSGPGTVKVTWKTQGLETTTISSNPAVSGLPKTVTGSSNSIDSFPVKTTTTFEIKGQTPGQGAPFTKIASATVTVRGTPPVK